MSELNKRNRKFHYKIEKWDKNMIESIESIDAKYHIYGFSNQNTESSILCGFLYFTNPKTPSKLNKNHFFGRGLFLELERDIDAYKTMEDCWEKGEPPTQARKTIAKKRETVAEIVDPVAPVTVATEIANQNNTLLQQNSTLIQHSHEMCHFLMKQNEKLMEENQHLKQVSTNITNHIQKMENTTNIENKTFNISVFLNEDCKDAVTLNDFVNSLKIEDADLFYAKENGLSEAITNIFERGLKNCDVNSRPLHCTDRKRETLHIKDADGWVKETGNESKHMKNAINRISKKNIVKLAEYMKEHPEFDNVNSPKYEDCLKMMRGVMGADEEEEVTKKRVLRNILKTVYISTH